MQRYAPSAPDLASRDVVSRAHDGGNPLRARCGSKKITPPASRSLRSCDAARAVACYFGIRTRFLRRRCEAAADSVLPCGQRSYARAPTGRTYGRKRSDQITATTAMRGGGRPHMGSRRRSASQAIDLSGDEGVDLGRLFTADRGNRFNLVASPSRSPRQNPHNASGTAAHTSRDFVPWRFRPPAALPRG